MDAAELAPKKPPPLVPSCLIATMAAAGRGSHSPYRPAGKYIVLALKVMGVPLNNKNNGHNNGKRQ